MLTRTFMKFLGRCPSWVPVLTLAVASSFWIGQTRGWHPWGFATQTNVFSFVDLTGRLANLDQLFQTGNIYHVFDYLAFTYPPTAITLFAPFHFLTVAACYWLWTFISLVALATLCYQGSLLVFEHNHKQLVLSSSALMVFGIALLPSIYECLDLGQTGLIICALVIYDYFHPSRGQGLLVGVAIALKILPLLFVVWWIVNRNWRAARNSLAMVVAFVVLAFIFWGKSTDYYIRVIVRRGAEFHQLLSGPKLRANSSVIAPLVVGPQRAFFISHKWLLGLIILTSVVFFLMATRYLHSHYMPLAALITLTIGSNVVSLVTWDHYLVVVILLPLLWWRETPLGHTSGKLILASFLLYVVPWWRMRYGRLSHQWSHSLHVFALLGPQVAMTLFLIGVLTAARRRQFGLAPPVAARAVNSR